MPLAVSYKEQDEPTNPKALRKNVKHPCLRQESTIFINDSWQRHEMP